MIQMNKGDCTSFIVNGLPLAMGAAEYDHRDPLPLLSIFCCRLCIINIARRASREKSQYLSKSTVLGKMSSIFGKLHLESYSVFDMQILYVSAVV